MSRAVDLARVRTVLGSRSAAELSRPRRAAVALVLSTPGGALSALLVRRAERIGDPWSGHMALPGGHEHPSDADLLQTARRETLEEVGLDLTHSELLGQLDDVSPLRSPTLLVRPFVFWTTDFPPLVHSDEVAETLWVPISELAGDMRRAMREVEIASVKHSVPAFVLGDRVVWGMTFHLLERFVADILPEP